MQTQGIKEIAPAQQQPKANESKPAEQIAGAEDCDVEMVQDSAKDAQDKSNNQQDQPAEIEPDPPLTQKPKSPSVQEEKKRPEMSNPEQRVVAEMGQSANERPQAIVNNNDDLQPQPSSTNNVIQVTLSIINQQPDYVL